ncbi:S1 RNA-binding domain-containing protein, partial [Candidatus Gracilibacteria bacterium]|nr:S1 RNA-binding domain-containing protein [Candidatus Gracilibacteria bacterium]
MATATSIQMEELLKNVPDLNLPEPGQLVDGKIVAIHKNKIIMDLNGVATGMISGREAKDSEDTMKKAKVGDMITAFVIEGENDEGYYQLSLRKANQERTWKRFIDAYEKQDVITVKANEANKGGLLLDIDGIKGFIPVSQLAPMHYPRVNDADANMILQRLQELVGQKFLVKIINIDKENGKLILSEKAAMEEQRKQALGKLKVGDVVNGKISGIVKFGIFVAFDGLEGLVHISEIAWGHVKNPGDYGKLGDKVDVMVIGLDGDKISLSMKRLSNDPWLEAAKVYKIGSVVEGEVNRLTPFGAFVKLSDEI